MNSEAEEVILVVREDTGGWVVVDGTVNGPFFSKIRAVDLAQGMADAIRATGQRARVVVSGSTAPMSASVRPASRGGNP